MSESKYKQSEISELTQERRIPRGWKVIKLCDVSIAFVSGGTPPTSRLDYWDGDMAWMTSSHLTGREVTTAQRHITREGLENSATNVVPKDSLLVATRVGIGKVAVNRIDTAISQDLTGIVLDKKRVSTDFLYWLLSSSGHKLRSLAQGSTIRGILRQDLGKLELFLPSLPEQQRIAEMLSTVDRGIESVNEAIEKTQRLKKGLMQRLLARGIGHSEFKDTKVGRIPKEWEVVRLADIAYLERGKFAHRPRNDPRFYGGEVPFIQTGDISQAQGIIRRYTQTLNEEGLNISKLFKRGTMVISIAGNIGDVALLGFDACFPDSVVGITVNSRADCRFLMYLLHETKSKLSSMAPRSTQKNVNLEILEHFKLPLPPLSEQQRIAEILSTVDRRLELLRAKKERLERVKGGLMNDLLTGKKRVKVES